MIRNKQLAVLHAASTDSTRYNLNSVRFEADGSLVATDGHMLAVVKPETEEADGGIDPFVISLESAKTLNKGTRGKQNVGACVDRDATNGNGSLRVTLSDGSALELPKVEFGDDGFYPDWQQVMPKNGRKIEHRVGLSLHVLERMVTIARQATETRKGEQRTLVFEFGSEFEPVKVTDPKDEALTIVLMPCRL